MNAVAAQFQASGYHPCATRGGNVGSALPMVRSRFGDVAMVVFLLAQAGDGVLTYIGVRTYGLGIEGNPIIAWLMSVLGHGVGLTAAKIAAAGFGVALHLSAVHNAVAALAAFYLLAAITPWVLLLFIVH